MSSKMAQVTRSGFHQQNYNRTVQPLPWQKDNISFLSKDANNIKKRKPDTVEKSPATSTLRLPHGMERRTTAGEPAFWIYWTVPIKMAYTDYTFIRNGGTSFIDIVSLNKGLARKYASGRISKVRQASGHCYVLHSFKIRRCIRQGMLTWANLFWCLMDTMASHLQMLWMTRRHRVIAYRLSWKRLVSLDYPSIGKRMCELLVEWWE